MSSRRASSALALVVAVLHSACTIDVPFDCTWRLPVAANPGGGSFEVPLDLSEQAEIWSRRDSVEAIRAEEVRVRVLQVGAHNQAETMRLALSFRPEGGLPSGMTDLPVLEATEIRVTPDSTLTIAAPSELGDAVRDALRGSGRFAVIAELEIDRPIDATLELGMSGAAVVTP